jgi:broad specificity phosphatase PhoE
MSRLRPAALSLAILLGAAASAAAQGTVVLVRHAERADQPAGAPAMMASDPDLSEAGRARAERLAAMLKDAGITAIFTTQYKRTRQTAEPLAKSLGLAVQSVDARDVDGLAAKVKAEKGNVLVVGHSNTVPDAIKALGVDTGVTIADADYDNLFLVTLTGARPSMVRLRFR